MHACIYVHVRGIHTYIHVCSYQLMYYVALHAYHVHVLPGFVPTLLSCLGGLVGGATFICIYKYVKYTHMYMYILYIHVPVAVSLLVCVTPFKAYHCIVSPSTGVLVVV